eukprot:TRINITY_DN358_c0_g1_i1.p1 TRINITY_DN358_c0_g1~~TRINITY_DN358_c0_g1_i1.p1  ORF type:complete len:504 (+),score=-57.59 TRINITY_DN358_c0_g1_i1:110-1513(+)
MDDIINLEYIKKYWIGLMDSKGEIFVKAPENKYLKFYFVLEFPYTESNHEMLQLIVQAVGGSIKIVELSKKIYWEETDKENINNLINILTVYPFLTKTKQVQLQFLKECLNHNDVQKFLDAENSNYLETLDKEYFMPKWRVKDLDFKIRHNSAYSTINIYTMKELLINDTDNDYVHYKVLLQNRKAIKIYERNKSCLDESEQSKFFDSEEEKSFNLEEYQKNKLSTSENNKSFNLVKDKLIIFENNKSFNLVKDKLTISEGNKSKSAEYDDYNNENDYNEDYDYDDEDDDDYDDDYDDDEGYAYKDNACTKKENNDENTKFISRDLSPEKYKELILDIKKSYKYFNSKYFPKMEYEEIYKLSYFPAWLTGFLEGKCEITLTKYNGEMYGIWLYHDFDFSLIQAMKQYFYIAPYIEHSKDKFGESRFYLFFNMLKAHQTYLRHFKQNPFLGEKKHLYSTLRAQNPYTI